MTGFYLVQRMEAKSAPYDPSRGFDSYFSLDYMGSSEFEWGAVPKALAAMRTQTAVVEPARVSIGSSDHDVWFVGHLGVSGASAAMADWATGTNRRPAFYGKEWTRFNDVLTGDAAPYIRTNAWWDIESNVAWTLDPKIAELLATAFNSRKAVAS